MIFAVGYGTVKDKETRGSGRKGLEVVTWLEPLKRMKADSGLTTAEIARGSGIPEPTLEKLFAGATKAPQLATMQRLVYFLGHTLEELFPGERSAPPRSDGAETDAERSHLQKYRALDGYGREAVDGVLETEYRRCREQGGAVLHLPETDGAEVSSLVLPEVLQPAAAGYGDPADDETTTPVRVLSTDLTRKADYILRVHGDSMEPQLHDGDRVLVRRQPSVEIGETGIFLRDGERVIKIYRGDRLESVNPKYGSLPFCGFSACKGLVLGVLRPEWILKK